LIKFEIVDHLLTRCLTKSFVSKIAKDIAMGGCVTKEQAITHTKHLDLVYSQAGTLYDMLPDAPIPSSDLATSKSLDTPPVDGVIFLVTQTPAKSSSKQKSFSNTSSNDSSHNLPSLGKTSEVHAVQSTTKEKSYKDKNKGKGKVKVDALKQGPPKSSIGDASQWKPNYPCLICEEDRYTKDRPRQSEVSRFLKGALVVLKEPFPSQQTQMVDQPQSSASSSSQVFMMTMPINVATRSKDYQTPTLKVGKEKEFTPYSSILSSSGPLHIE